MLLKARPLWLGQGPLRPLPATNLLGQADTTPDPNAPPCTTPVPDGYGPLPTGGAAPGKAVYACLQDDGTYAIFNQADGAFVIKGVQKNCLSLFGDLTLAPGDSRCGGRLAPQVPGAGCSFPTDRPIVACPPSNGSATSYAVDAQTGNYVGFDLSPDCLTLPNVTQVDATNPYCGGGGIINGPGVPDLVVCYSSDLNKAGIVDVYSAGPDFTLLASQISDREIATKFPGKVYIGVRGQNCRPTGITTPAAPAPVGVPPAQAPPPPEGIPVQNIQNPPAPGAGIPVQNSMQPAVIPLPPAAPPAPSGGVTKPPPAAPSSISTPLLVAGGIGVVGAAAALIFGVFRK